MKNILLTALIVGLCSTGTSQVQQAPRLQVTDRQVELVEGKILRIHSTEHSGAQSTDYIAEWDNSEIIVSDPWQVANKKEGEFLEFIVSRVTFERAKKEHKVVHFMVMEKHEMLRLTTPPTPQETKEHEELRATAREKMKENERRVQEMKERSNQSQ